MATAKTATEQQHWKRAAAEAAARIVENGMLVGLGSGSTAQLFVEALGRRVAQEGLRIVGIATSQSTAALAASLRIPLTSFAEHTQIDLTIDGADEVKLGALELIKGHGGALLREKIVAAASKRMAIVADETKVVKRLGSLVSVPVEVVQYGWEATLRKLEKLGAHPTLRVCEDGKPFVTDGGNFIFHCAYGAMKDPEEIAHELDHVVGAVEHGLFLGFATQVFVGGADGVKLWKKGEGLRSATKSKRGKKRRRAT
jgi:ribose 5-phosphate isomerase A